MKYLLFVLVLFLLLLLVVKIHLHIYIKIENKHMLANLHLQLFKWKKEIPLKKFNNEQMKKRGKKFISSIHLKNHLFFIGMRMKNILMKFFNTLELKDVYWFTTFGFHDAATTGTCTGIIWSIKSNCIGLISQLVKMKNPPILQVTPNFQATGLDMEFRCIISFQIGHVITAGIRFLSLLIKLNYMSKATTKTSLEYHTIEK